MPEQQRLWGRWVICVTRADGSTVHGIVAREMVAATVGALFETGLVVRLTVTEAQPWVAYTDRSPVRGIDEPWHQPDDALTRILRPGM